MPMRRPIQRLPRPVAQATALTLALLGISACTRTAASVRPPASGATAGTTKPVRQVDGAIDAGDGDYEARSLRAKLDANPADLTTRLALANHYRSLGFPEVAVEHLRLACDRAPDSVDAHLALARILRQEHRAAEGAEILSKFAVRHEGEVEIWAWIGLLRDEANDWKSGEIAYRRAISLQPARDDLRNNLGYCLLHQGRKEEAAAEFREALRANPQSAIARDNLGLALADNPKEAVLNWQSVSGPASAHNNLAVTLIEAGKYPEARREIETALSYDRENPSVLSNLALLSQLDGKASEVPPPARRETKLERLRSAWHHFWSGNPAPDAVGKDSGSSVASR